MIIWQIGKIVVLKNNFFEKAKELVKQTGDRATYHRIRTLCLLLEEHHPLTHREIEERLNVKEQLDRVTLYRVLEWMTKKNLIHKIAGDDRVWRFRVNTDLHSHHHAHFICTRCTKVTCLDEFKLKPNPSLPIGYLLHDIELTVKGFCAECT
ncbi:Fur family ferric uptake transcriptional regulator [Nitrosomonas nitrosa]|uniref:Fur family transcriptional regulator, ferric uptake regulator n=1 Tax=Nitrosomonas nitrosa TaxID=52442 RepID=A0A1I4P5B2_9PROT|nr:Fur family ferric uptake transcriptional regulator [Nitrosomonas nitrosa]SFM22835.1 Fur family transcriptional regulator, ferric uptake regulator [Nitrosomonas nitrosa]